MYLKSGHFKKTSRYQQRSISSFQPSHNFGLKFCLYERTPIIPLYMRQCLRSSPVDSWQKENSRFAFKNTVTRFYLFFFWQRDVGTNWTCYINHATVKRKVGVVCTRIRNTTVAKSEAGFTPHHASKVATIEMSVRNYASEEEEKACRRSSVIAFLDLYQKAHARPYWSNPAFFSSIT